MCRLPAGPETIGKIRVMLLSVLASGLSPVWREPNGSSGVAAVNVKPLLMTMVDRAVRILGCHAQESTDMR